MQKMATEDAVVNEEKVALSGEEPIVRDSSTAGFLRQLAAACAASLGPLSLGMVLGYSSPALPQLIGGGILDEYQGSWYASLVSVGPLVGGPCGGALADTLGRKTGLLFNALFYVIGWLLNIVSENVWLLYTGRFVAGLAIGISTVCTPVYIAEVSTPSLRSYLGSCFQIALSAGIVIAYCFGMVLDWRWLTIACACASAVMALVVVAIPESPMWLLRHGRKEEAMTALMWARAAQSEGDIAGEWQELNNGLKFGDNGGKLTMKCAKEPMIYKPFLLGMGLMLIQQFSGVTAITIYTNIIFTDAGFTGNSGIPTVITGSLQLSVTIVTTFFLNRVGRRVMLIISGIVMSISCVGFGLYFYLDLPSLRWLSLASLGLYFASYSIGWGPLPCILTAELLSPKGYGVTSGIIAAAMWIGSFIITKEFVAMQYALTTYGTFWCLGGVCLLGAIFAWRCIPETKGKSLHEIRMYFVPKSHRADAKHCSDPLNMPCVRIEPTSGQWR